MQNDGARVVAVCISEKKGTRKHEISLGVLEENAGFIGDAHFCPESVRQVSLLASESIKKMQEKGLVTNPGLFAENIVTSGLDLLDLKPGTRISIGRTVVLEITQIGKECHLHCEVYRRIGDCIMPREGVFARVVRGGRVQKGDKILQVETPESNSSM
jgi:MOSC domain-containing protein YiiM